MVEIESGHCFYCILSEDMISFVIITGSLTSQDMIKIHKQSRHDFPSKMYVMDIVWMILYHVMFMCGGQNSTEGYIVL